MNTQMNASGTPLIGIVTVLFNSDEVLPGFFLSLSRQRDVNFRLYVIDNSPTDSGSLIARSLAKQYGIVAQVLFNNENRGVAAGNNQGVAVAIADHCDFVLLSNNDVEFEPRTISKLLTALVEENERVAVPKIMYYSTPDTIWYAGGCFNLWKGNASHYGQGTIDSGEYDAKRYTQYAPTCFMLLRAGVFELVGFMDTRYFVYYDDADLVWRMQARGIRMRFVSQAKVLHKVSSSTGGGRSPFWLYYGNRNRMYFIRKNLSGLQRIIAMSFTLATRVPRLALDGPAALVVGLRGVLAGLRMAFFETPTRKS